MLVKNPAKLRHTDIYTPALEWISRADFRSVQVLGRRGWVQASFTNKELREVRDTHRAKEEEEASEERKMKGLGKEICRKKNRVLTVFLSFSLSGCLV